MLRQVISYRFSLAMIGVATWAAGGSALATGAAPAPPTHTATRSAACWTQADQKGLTGAERTKFHATCTQGAMGVTTSTPTKEHNAAAQALLAPSGQDRATRSRVCTAEADKKATSENARKEIRLSCLASAAPASHTGTPTHPPTPTPAKPGYDTLPR